MRKNYFTIVCVLTTMMGHAQDSLQSITLQEVVVSGTKFELPVEKSGKVIFKLDQKDLTRNAGRSLADVLHEVPGMQMDGNYSNVGANLSYYVRGGRNRHSLITLDGIPLVDPSGIEPFFDLRFVPLQQLESVEVMQGSLSTLYGSSAAAGVISLQTKKSDEDGVRGSVGVQAGSWKTFGQNVSLAGRFKKTSFSLFANNYSSEGFSSALDNDPLTTFDKDGLKKRNVFLRTGHDFTSQFSLSLFVGYDWLDNEFDGGAFNDADNSQVYEHLRFGVKSSYHYVKGSIDMVVQRSIIDRDEKDSFATQYKGSNWFAEVVHKHQLSPRITLLSGINAQRLAYGQEEVNERDTTSFILVDPYTSMFIDLSNGFNLHAGVRLNTHSEYGNAFLYNINPSWQFKINSSMNIKAFASLATAYITPTLFQLHTTWGGNKNLKPEKDITAEYGATFSIKKNLQLTAVHYYREEKNSIGYSTDFQYVNISDTRYVNGITLDARWAISENLNLQTDYAFVTTNLENTFYRIPNHKAGISLNYQAPFGTNVSVRYQFTGKRTDLYFDELFVPHDIELESYNLLDVSVSQSLIQNHLILSAAVYNVADENFIGVYGYTTRGRNFTLGLTYNF